MNVWKRKSQLIAFAVMLCIAIIIVPASATVSDVNSTSAPIFTIPEKTTVYDVKAITEKSEPYINYDSLKIPEIVTASSNAKKESHEISSYTEIYNVICFNNPIPERKDKIVIPITIYGNEHKLELNKMKFENINDGIDSYEGVISGIAESHVVLTVDMDNILCGFISYPGEYIAISAIQASEDCKTTGMPLHIVYSEYDMLTPENPVEFCGVKGRAESKTIATKINGLSGSTAKGVYDTVYVDVLVVTDNAFYSSSWTTTAQSYIATANSVTSYGRDDVKVVLVPHYNDAERFQLSGNFSISTYPLDTLVYYYPISTLNFLDMDLCLYLGGYDIEGPDNIAQGLAWISGRYAWSQMVTDWSGPVYNGDDYSRTYCIIHELGHCFEAMHEQSYTWGVLLGVKNTVMLGEYYGLPFNLLEFSSPNYNGDLNHNNALTIRNSKIDISSYA